MALAVIQSVSFFLFIHTFPRPKVTFKKKYLYMILSMAFLTIIVSFTPLLFKDVLLENNKRLPVVQPGILLFLVTAIGSLLSGFILLIQRLKKEVGLINIQLKYIFYGSFLMFLLILIFNFFLVVIFKISTFVNWLPYLILPFLFSTTYAITRYRLMDIKIVLRKGIVYGLSIIIALAFYTYLAILLKDYLQNTLNISENWGIFVLILLVALGFPPLKNLVERSINTLFKGKKSIDLAVKEVQEKMAVKTDTDSLIDLIVREIRKFLGLEEVEILLINRQEKKFIGQEKSLDFSQPIVKYLQEKGEIVVKEEIPYMLEADHEFDHKALKEVENKMNKLNIAVAVPVGKGDELISLILLGRKKSEEAFTVDDIKFLERLSGQALFSLGNAVLYRDAMARIKAMQYEQTENN